MTFLNLRQINAISKTLEQYIKYAQNYSEYGVKKDSIPIENVVNLLTNMVDEILEDL